MHSSRFARRAVTAFGALAVCAAPLSLPGCGGGAGDKPEMVAPKEPITVSSKDSMSNYLNSQAHNQSLHKGGRR